MICTPKPRNAYYRFLLVPGLLVVLEKFIGIHHSSLRDSENGSRSTDPFNRTLSSSLLSDFEIPEEPGRVEVVIIL